MATYVPTRLSQTRKEEKKVRNHDDYFLERERRKKVGNGIMCEAPPLFFRFHTFAVATKDKIKRRSLFFFSFFGEKKVFRREL